MKHYYNNLFLITAMLFAIGAVVLVSNFESQNMAGEAYQIGDFDYQPPNPLYLSLSKSPHINGTLLSWESNADYCYARGPWSGEKPTTGTQPVSPNQESRYGMTCYRADRYNTSVTRSVIVEAWDADEPTYSDGFYDEDFRSPREFR